MATDALVLKHQAIGTHSADNIFIVLGQFHIQNITLYVNNFENKITFWKKKYPIV